MKLSLTECPHRLPIYESAKSAVIFLHGYGSNGQDLISIADVWQPALPNTIFLSPNAPQPCIANPFGGYQWFPLTTFSEDELWTGVTQAAPEVQEFIHDTCAQLAILAGRVVLVGFSQGTMMALHVAFRRKQSIKVLVGFSGALVGQSHFAKECIAHPEVFLTHGDADDVVPSKSLSAALHTLNMNGIEAQSYMAHGVGHHIDEQMLLRSGRFVVEQLLK